MTARPDAARAFQSLHRTAGGFVMPNAWDAGSAVILAEAGFPAIASTSAGIAFSLARPDYASGARAVSREAMLARVREIVEAVDVPVNGDLEAGYGETPQAVAETVRLAIAAGLAGGNIEDARPEGGLFEESEAAERIAAAREAIDASGVPFVLTARTDSLVWAREEGLTGAIRRANCYRAAGADCLYAPPTLEPADVATLAREIEGPLNIVLGLGSVKTDARALLAAGAQRISLGGSIARTALASVREAALELTRDGTIGFADRQIPQAELNALFSR